MSICISSVVATKHFEILFSILWCADAECLSCGARSAVCACERCVAEQQHSSSCAKSHSVSFAVAIFQAASCSWAHVLCVISSPTCWIWHLPSTFPRQRLQHDSARGASHRCPLLPTCCVSQQRLQMKLPSPRPAEEHLWWVLKMTWTLFSWMTEGWENLSGRWLASRYLAWNIWLVLGFYNDRKPVLECPRHNLCPSSFPSTQTSSYNIFQLKKV